MYLYNFSHQARQEGVVFCSNLEKKFKKGDLLLNNEQYFLVLWTEISFSELYIDIYDQKGEFILVERGFLRQNTVDLMHWMVYQRFSNYKTVIKLFLDRDIPALLCKKPYKILKKKQKSKLHIGNTHLMTDDAQILCVFPDLRTLENMVHHSDNVFLLPSMDTQNKKNTLRRKVRSWEAKIILTTSSEIFQDFNNLQSIYFIEPQKRYYASQQDPRYKVGTVLQKIAELTGACLHILESEAC